MKNLDLDNTKNYKKVACNIFFQEIFIKIKNKFQDFAFFSKHFHVL